ncbi:MAG: methionine adenosyltransferase [Acidipropionibacterium acidipropionici]|jgi:S-adenosylmethionine synthetase|uniref:S-adenosylmethionine synthase n=1 Tax=Acidipropionibacterium acidipropionici (strain ATCC 4875 / DSM 20272 / JCM 6432 / NBRC 12425 / NCIMB 8070 / 4) TaxID=1171373 RepID=K7SJT8_ACIA4|nr:methionine adenosyltransferase [Acidipropionibacterium acidipropionici]AFV89570.1 S-adenosylmethionine synthase [Acidipropionibacterium acidipropionici ATCC 4875]ALN15984.1 S-adenosylmethionine synthetase [Acidipropionibacterium acidipropionici]APZ08270.1 methionine adenosyltransferase [Acidipropionibacterium acidipropionici]QCV95009.1 methionine adenosyltransferase [Acidipropionibacterium acidipropionici]
MPISPTPARLFSSESVTEGHPDKIADAISDSVLDAMIAEDPQSHVAVETLVTTGQVMVCGEVTTEAYVDIAGIARDKILEIGYDSSSKGFDGASCGVSVAIDAQSPDIAQGVNTAYEARHGSTDSIDAQGAGDQGLMFGYACTDTESLMPLPIDLAHALSLRLTRVRKDGTLDYLGPDGKTQVTIRYDEAGRPVGVDTVVVSTQHRDGVSIEGTIAPDLRRHVIDPVLESYGLPTTGLEVLVNPTGKFVIGGPMGDAGLTGRKIIVDTYGGMARHGGGAFSGKDPSKVDRSASYAMRWVAKNVVAAGLAERCECQVAYAIGRARPVSLRVETFGTNKADEAAIERAVSEVFDLRPAAIVADLDLLHPIYSQLVAGGHFGRALPGVNWELTDRTDDLLAAVDH